MAAGLDVQVVEARDRVGGRLLSTELGGAVFDIGGQWLGPGQDRMYALARELGIETFPTFHQGKKMMDLGGKVGTYSGNVPNLHPLDLVQVGVSLQALELLRRQVDPAAPWRARWAEYLDRTSLASFAARVIPSRTVRGAFDAAVRVVFGVETSELSMLHFLSYSQAGGGFMRLVEIEDGAQRDRLRGGAQQFAQRLADELGDRVRLAAPVRRIEHGEQGARVVLGSGDALLARFAVVAVPPNLATRIDFEPLLPASQAQLLERMPMGVTVKVLCLYDRPFWRERGLSGEVVSDAEPFSVTFDNTDHTGVAALVGFSVAQPGRNFSALKPEERKRKALAQLSQLFGSEAASPTHYLEQDWSREVYSRGCPVASLPVGMAVGLGKHLRQPVGPLHWAGTETATEWTGYMEGAVDAGHRAADEVIARA